MRGGVPCRCVADAARRLRRDEINAASPLGLCQFASFEVERYSDAVEPELGISPREYMGKLLNYCRGYAAKFSQNSPNLLFMGHTGLGKTHLALAIADAVLEGGHDVLYTSAAALAAQLGREHFNYTTNDEWLAACQEADLLILDEAGSAWELDMVDKALLQKAVLERPAEQECVLTAHAAPQWMLDAADYATEMKCHRHPYQRGISARQGIEY